MAKAVPAVRDHDPLVGADERVELLAAAVTGDLQERRLRGGRVPHRASRTAGPSAALPTAQLVRAMLAHDHADRRQLTDLVATEPPARPALPIIEPAPASATRIRIVIDDLIHLILRPQLPSRARVTGLPTRL